jgi:hypothetical protein
MTRLLLVPLVCAVLLALAAPTTGAARAVSRTLTPDEVRAVFLRAGYLVGEPAPWSGEVSMLAVRRPEAPVSDRALLRVFVFADEEAAAAEHRRAHAADEARSNRPIVASDDRGPRLLIGYGASVWRHNVAVVQASPIDDLSAYPVEPDCAPTPVFTDLSGADPTPPDLTLPATGVDPGVVELLENIAS